MLCCQDVWWGKVALWVSGILTPTAIPRSITSCGGFLICQHVLQIIDDKGVAIADADHPILQAAVDNELVGPDSKPTDDMNRAVSLAVPLERQISFKFPTVITPSEQAEDLRHIGEDNTEQVMTAKQAAKAYAGMRRYIPS